MTRPRCAAHQSRRLHTGVWRCSVSGRSTCAPSDAAPRFFLARPMLPGLFPEPLPESLQGFPEFQSTGTVRVVDVSSSPVSTGAADPQLSRFRRLACSNPIHLRGVGSGAGRVLSAINSVVYPTGSRGKVQLNGISRLSSAPGWILVTGRDGGSTSHGDWLSFSRARLQTVPRNSHPICWPPADQDPHVRRNRENPFQNVGV